MSTKRKKTTPKADGKSAESNVKQEVVVTANKAVKQEASGASDVEPKQGTGADLNPDVIKKKFDDYAMQLKDGAMRESKNAWIMAHKTKKHTSESLSRAKALYDVIIDAQDEYNKLNRNIVLNALQEKDDLTIGIGEYKALYTELSKGLQEACLAIKDINKKMIAVKNAANQLEQDVKDTCNQKDANDLESKLSLDLGSKEPATFNMAVKNLHNQADYSLQDTVEIFNAAVKAAGISALLNLDGLEASFQEVGANVDSLVEDVAGNITSVAEMAAAQATLYETGIKTDQGATDSKVQKGTQYGAMEETIRFVETGHVELRGKKLRFEMDDLQKKVKEELNL